jgi:hypothetical protein
MSNSLGPYRQFYSWKPWKPHHVQPRFLIPRIITQEFTKLIHEAKPLTSLPPGYSYPAPDMDNKHRKKSKPNHKKGKAQPVKLDKDSCPSCHLKPCIAELHSSKADELFFDLQIVKGKSDLVAQNTVKGFLQRKYCQAITTRYLKKLEPPECVTEKVASYHDVFSRLEATKKAKEAVEATAHEEINNKPEQRKEKPIHRFHYGDTSSENESEDEDSSQDGSSDDSQSLYAILRDHEVGDLPMEEKVRVFNTKKEQQKAVTKSRAMVKRKRKRSIMEWLEASSDKENEF